MNDPITLLQIIIILVLFWTIIANRQRLPDMSALLDKAAAEYYNRSLAAYKSLEESLGRERERVAVLEEKVSKLEHKSYNDERVIAKLQGWLDERNGIIDQLREELKALREFSSRLEKENIQLREIEAKYVELLAKCEGANGE